jgi:hypothetical protein
LSRHLADHVWGGEVQVRALAEFLQVSRTHHPQTRTLSLGPPLQPCPYPS